MHEKFNDRARMSMALSDIEGHRYNHDSVRPEHIMLGLVLENAGIGARVLNGYGFDAKTTRVEIEKYIKTEPEKILIRRLPYSEETNKVLESAEAFSKKRMECFIGTQHLLYGILEIGDVPYKVFSGKGISVQKVKDDLINLLVSNAEEDIFGYVK